MELHTGFIVAAFAVSGLVVAVMVGAILLDYRGLMRALARFPRRDEEDRS